MRISIFLFMLACLCGAGISHAQPSEKTLKKVLTLTPSDYAGGNGGAVVWHPAQKKYYTARAGNVTYPLDVFNAAGKRISGNDVTTMVDVRGMWYNSAKKKIYVSGYAEYGWSTYELDKAGIPASVTNIADGQNQPDANSVPCFDAKKSLVYFLDGTSIYAYNATTAKKTSDYPVITLASGIRGAYGSNAIESDSKELPSFYNQALIYTGVPGQEFGLLNADKKQIDLYSTKTGERTQVLHLPSDTNPEHVFNFAYANDMYFIYDKTDHVWKGYK
jgi:hypothetical protein